MNTAMYERLSGGMSDDTITFTDDAFSEGVITFGDTVIGAGYCQSRRNLWWCRK